MAWWLSSNRFESLIANAEVLEAEDDWVKVYRLPDNRVVKLFRIRRWLSLSVIFPYSLRFAVNARRLLHLRRMATVRAQRDLLAYIKGIHIVFPWAYALSGFTFHGLCLSLS